MPKVRDFVAHPYNVLMSRYRPDGWKVMDVDCIEVVGVHITETAKRYEHLEDILKCTKTAPKAILYILVLSPRQNEVQTLVFGVTSNA